MLSRNDMKAIMGGYGSCTGGNKIVDGHLWVCYLGEWVDMGQYSPGF